MSLGLFTPGRHRTAVLRHGRAGGGLVGGGAVADGDSDGGSTGVVVVTDGGGDGLVVVVGGGVIGVAGGDELVVVMGGVAARGAGCATPARATDTGGAGSVTMGRPPLPLVPGGTGPGAEGVGMRPVR